MCKLYLGKVQGKTTNKWHTDDIWVYTDGIWMIYEYIRVTYKWQTSTYRQNERIQMACKWHANEILNRIKDLQLSNRSFENYLCEEHWFRRLQMIFGYFYDSHIFYQNYLYINNRIWESEYLKRSPVSYHAATFCVFFSFLFLFFWSNWWLINLFILYPRWQYM